MTSPVSRNWFKNSENLKLQEGEEGGQQDKAYLITTGDLSEGMMVSAVLAARGRGGHSSTLYSNDGSGFSLT